MIASMRARITLDNEDRGVGKLTQKDIGTERGKKLSMHRAADAKKKMAETQEFLRKKGRI